MKLLPRKLKCFLRYTDNPRWAQDRCTFILLGRYCWMYNVGTGLWFFISEVMPLVNGLPEFLRRPGGELEPASLEQLLFCGGRRARLAIWEDRIGIRLCWVAQFLCKLPLLGRLFRRIRPLKRIARMDIDQDWRLWHEFEPPKILGWEVK